MVVLNWTQAFLGKRLQQQQLSKDIYIYLLVLNFKNNLQFKMRYVRRMSGDRLRTLKSECLRIGEYLACAHSESHVMWWQYSSLLDPRKHIKLIFKFILKKKRKQSHQQNKSFSFYVWHRKSWRAENKSFFSFLSARNMWLFYFSTWLFGFCVRTQSQRLTLTPACPAHTHTRAPS